MTDVNMNKVIERIKKLAALAGNNSNEAEASSATAKMQELLEAYNLDMSVLGKSGKGAQRRDTKLNGGLYSWQRKLWQSVAELNFCYYFSLKGLKAGSVYEHRLVGSPANVVATEVMARYLQETIEKLAQRWAKDIGYNSVFVREAIAYREGMAKRISERLMQRREELVNEQRRKREEARNGTAPTANALTIVDVISSEADFNNDYLNGWEMGTTARNRAEREARQKAWEANNAAKQAAYEEWARKNPEEAARKQAILDAENKAWWEKYQMKMAKRRPSRAAAEPRYRKPTPEEERAGLSSYRSGYAKGNEVGIDQQVDRANRPTISVRSR